MAPDETNPRQVAAYRRRSNEYWAQAKELWAKGNTEKASELAWGSVAERVKAVALARTGQMFRSHRLVGEYVDRLARELASPDLERVFDRAARLHQNFYEADLSAEAVRARLVDVEWLLNRLDLVLRGTP